MSKTPIIIIVITLVVWSVSLYTKNTSTTGAPPFGVSRESADQAVLPWSSWTRPDVPAKVAIQVGHYKNDELPDELENLRNNDGAQVGNVTEVDINLEVSRLIAENLRVRGIDVEILPATVPQDYWSDVFLAIHADGSEDTGKSGYKFATSWRDATGKANDLMRLLRDGYGDATGLEWDPNITRNMRGYYAFAWWRYDHSIHPMTTPVIIELGFLTNPSDRALLVNTPEIPADAISEGVVRYLESENLID